jgi:16S rRNA (cytosine1402-N4)-methyltransferase
MLEEVAPGYFDENVYIDGTLGGGGHAKAILEKILPRGRLVGIDCDKDGILASQGSLENFRENLIIVKDNFFEKYGRS